MSKGKFSDFEDAPLAEPIRLKHQRFGDRGRNSLFAHLTSVIENFRRDWEGEGTEDHYRFIRDGIVDDIRNGSLMRLRAAELLSRLDKIAAEKGLVVRMPQKRMGTGELPTEDLARLSDGGRPYLFRRTMGIRRGLSHGQNNRKPNHVPRESRRRSTY